MQQKKESANFTTEEAPTTTMTNTYLNSESLDREIYKMPKNNFVEKFNYDVLEYICQDYEQVVFANSDHPEHWEAVRKLFSLIYDANEGNAEKKKEVHEYMAQVKAYFKSSRRINPSSKAGVVDVNYAPSKKDKEGDGRLYAERALSMQGMHKMFRHTISHEFYADLDMVNCHPVILAHIICPRYQLECPRLLEYVADREKIVKEIQEANPELSASEIKCSVIIKIINNGGISRNVKKTSWLAKFKAEMSYITDALVEAEPERFATVAELDNPEGSHISKLMCVEENALLGIMFEYIKGKIGRDAAKECVLCFDGVMIPLLHFDKVKITEIEQLFADRGVPMKLKVKEMVPLKLPRFQQRKLFNAQNPRHGGDEYFIADFIQPLGKKIFNNISAVCDYFNQHVNRVFIRVFPEIYFMKINGEKTYAEVDKKSIPACPVTWYETKGEKIVPVSRSLRDLITGPHPTYSLLNTYDDFFIRPSAAITPATMYDGRKVNVWGGFQAKLLPEVEMKARLDEIRPWLHHLKVVLAGDNPEYYEYLCNWFHCAFKHPDEKTRVALIFRSEKQQIGKGFFFHSFISKFIFGDSLAWVGNIDQVTQQFNAHLLGKVFITMEEMSSLEGKNNYSAKFEVMKTFIADPKFRIEFKGGKSVQFENFFNVVAFTNNDFTIKVEKGDARYFIVDCDERYCKNREYFANLKTNYLNQEAADVFFSYMYYLQPTMDLQNDLPMTELKRRMMINSLAPPLRFVEYCRDIINDPGFYDPDISWHSRFKDAMDTGEMKIKPSALYQIFLDFCSEEREHTISMQKFGRALPSWMVKVNVKGYPYYKFKVEPKLVSTQPTVEDGDESSDF